ncbi:MAG: sensor histidine kinase [Planctomycetota bacterium]
MDAILWTVLGIVIGAAGALVAGRFVLHRAERRIREAERRARGAERLAELGHMTGGLAHEIKNPLSTIGLNAELLAESITDADLPDDQRERLLRRLDALSQGWDVCRIVTELGDFFDPQCRDADVALRTQLPDHPVPVEVDESLFKQALLNLMINATQAMSAAASTGDGSSGPRGELILRVEDDADEVRVHVIDTGPGIEPDRLDEMFHPYVSGRSGGTGLGLPTARRIVEEHGGRLAAHSEPGRGSDFVIHLPPDTKKPQE